MLAMLLLVASSTVTPAWRGAVGAQVDADPHGVFDVALRAGDWQFELNTDTLDVRYARAEDGYRYNVGARGELFVAGLMTSPWTGGARDPGRALFAHYGGLDGELVVYLGGGLYLGGAASARVYAFGLAGDNAGPTPEPELVAGPTLRLGWWREDMAAVIEGGVDVLAGNGVTVAPRAAFTGRFEPSWSLGPLQLGPLVEARAVIAEQQDRVTLTRVGGLTPYVVPVAGAAWAEWWAEDLLAARAGLRAKTGQVSLAVVVDGALMHTPLVADTDSEAWGLGVLAGLRIEPFFLDVAGGWAPRIPRQAGVTRLSLWASAGVDWIGL